MIQASNICLSFGNQEVFDDVSFTINQNDRIGLIGRNGSGKTTLLKAIIEPSILDDGAISIQNRKKIAYMPQEVVLASNLSILEETFSIFETLQDELVDEQKLKAKVKKMLMGLGFSTQQFDQPVSSLSVGWKMRIVLAKLLLQEADFYLFDEPTNHLDLIAKEWFLDFLKESDFGFILICHEKYFLDELCKKILELERGQANWYTGNYSNYVVKKEHDLALLMAAYVQQQKEITRKKETIERFRASASRAKMAQSMIKQLDKIERIEIPPSAKSVNFSFPPVQQSGKSVIKVTDVVQKFDDKIIFQNVSFEIMRGQKVALIAPNGAGKTTLFNIIAGKLPLQHGDITFGYNVTHAIFAQDQNKALNMNQTILDNINYICPKVSEQRVRSFLGAFLFSNEDVYKKVKVLSGGEKNRVGMVSVLLQNANLLLLDEPTNHLDIPSKEILLKALKEFNGTLLFVSHDRDFINDLATDIIELTSNGTYHFQGNYDSYLYTKEHSSQPVTDQENITAPNQEKLTNNFDSLKKTKKLEERMAKLEQQIQDIYTSFAELDYGTEEFNVAQDKVEKLKLELQETEKAWEASYKK